MNIEELKLIMETLSGVSDSAFWLAILYLTKGFVLSTTGYVLGFFVVSKITKLIYISIKESFDNEWKKRANATEKMINNIYDIVGINPNYVSYQDGHNDESELKKIKKIFDGRKRK